MGRGCACGGRRAVCFLEAFAEAGSAAAGRDVWRVLGGGGSERDGHGHGHGHGGRAAEALRSSGPRSSAPRADGQLLESGGGEAAQRSAAYRGRARPVVDRGCVVVSG